MPLALVVLVALFALPGVASAQTTITPTRMDDPVSGSAGCNQTSCSLRQALALADAPTTSVPVTIVLGQGTYFLQQSVPLQFPGGAKLTTIRGAGARLTTIDGRGLTRTLQAIEGSDGVLEDATVTGGAANANTSPANAGGGIWVDPAGKLALNRVTVAGNQAPSVGGGIYADGDLTVSNSTITNNQAGTGATGVGGGIVVAGNTTSLTNTTVAGNRVVGTRTSAGGGIYNTAAVVLRHVTLARNTATTGGLALVTSSTATIFSSIITSDTGTACGGDAAAIAAIAGDHNLDDDGTCGFGALGDKPGVNPVLGTFGANGGPTDTLPLGAASPAINAAAPSGCPLTDQRGVARPQLGACDMGAFEYRAPALTVVKRVVNDQGGTQAPGDFTVHVRLGGADVAGSPKPGSAAGTRYVLAPGTYQLAENTDSRYVATFSGGCGPTGAVVLAEGQTKTCTITNGDKPPVVGRIVNAEPRSGTVKVKLPKGKRFRRLREGEQLPVGTIVDTLKGRVTLFAAANKSGGTANAVFWDGIFKIGQSKGKRPITTLTLVEKLTGCKATGQASAAAKKKKKKRRLWGDGKGKFRTKGRNSAATVLGTKWLVEDRCISTLTKVARGRVSVRDFVKRKTVIVKKGKTYVARARKP